MVTIFNCCIKLLNSLCLLVTQLADTKDEQEFQSLMASEEYDFRYTCGVSKPTARILFPEKQQVVSAMCLHYSILVSLAELEQLRRGLAIQKFNSLMESYPQLIRKAFQPPQQEITSEFIEDLFDAVLSPKGSNKRVVEEAIMMMWIHYLQDLQGENFHMQTNGWSQ